MRHLINAVLVSVMALTALPLALVFDEISVSRYL